MEKNINYFKNFEELNNFKDLNNKSEYIIFATETFNLDIQKLLDLKIKFYGAIFPKIIYKNKPCNDGLLLIKLNTNSKVIFYPDINNAKFDNVLFESTKSVMAIFDGFSKYCTEFVENIFKNIKLHTSVFGGGAGILNDKNKSVVFSNEGIFDDAAFIVLLEQKIQLSVSHGWKYLEGPFIATKIDGNKLCEIDYENAFEIYKKIIEADCGIQLTKKNFLDIVMQYPLGIIKFDEESLIRDPYSFDEDGSLTLATKIHPNAIFNILKGEKKVLIDTASKSSKMLSENIHDSLFIFECITRLEFLRDDINIEIEQILKSSNTKYINGVFTLGEVGNNGNRHIDILNKSSVLSELWH